jgi:hypothetical protein
MNMKKYLMTGIAALAMGGMFTSCSHDMSLYNGDGTKAVVDKYEQAFVSAYGEPAANQTWGFGSTSAAATRGMTRTIDSSWDNWENAPAASDYATEMDPDAILFTSEAYGQGTEIKKYYLPESSDVFTPNVWMGNFIFYVSGTKSFQFTNPGDNADHMIFYVLPDADLTFTQEFNLQKPTDFKMYIAERAKVTFSNGLNSNIKLYNNGTVVVNGSNQCGVYGQGVIYNQGTMTFNSTKEDWDSSIKPYGANVSGALVIHNSGSQIVNEGTITTKGLRVEGSGHFKNVSGGTMNVNGYTIVNSNDCSWINDGIYNTENFRYTAGSTDVINNCRLNVSELFYMDLGDTEANCFKMDGGSGVVAQNYLAEGPGYIYMGANSVFKVTETATMDHSKVNYGIYGPTEGGYAVFQAKNIVKGKEGQGFEVTYGNNLYVSAESHFAQGNDGQADHPFIDLKGNAKIYAPGFEDGLPAVTITETTCNPGFIGSGPKAITESIRVIAEDLSASQRSDFDFNDVVFDVYWTHTPGSSDNQTVKVIVRAAGGELPIFIGNIDNALEIHNLFANVNDESRHITSKTMMNTYAGQHTSYTCPEVLVESNWWSGSDIQTIAKSIKIYVRKSGTDYELTAEKGEAACKIAVGTDYEWCDEREDINEKYNGNFEKYVKGQIADYEWY